jgi:hypothetical protein
MAQFATKIIMQDTVYASMLGRLGHSFHDIEAQAIKSLDAACC